MKSMTASEARRNWFRLLDEVVAGEVVEVRRGGKRIVLRCEPTPDAEALTPDYSGVFGSASVHEADRWGWDWDEDGLVPRDRPLG